MITNTLDSPAGQRALFYIHIPFPTSLKLSTVSAPNKQITGPSQCVLSEERRRNEGFNTAFPPVLDFWGGRGFHQLIASLHVCVPKVRV